MAKAKAAEAPQRAYPGIEVFLEQNDRSAVAQAFATTREALAAVPKLKAEHAKRALAAIEQTEALLNQLFDVKDQLSASAGKKKASR